MFGTFYMPANELPSDYGIGEADFPQTFGGQLLYPLKDKPQPSIVPRDGRGRHGSRIVSRERCASARPRVR